MGLPFSCFINLFVKLLCSLYACVWPLGSLPACALVGQGSNTLGFTKTPWASESGNQTLSYWGSWQIIQTFSAQGSCL